MVLHEVEQEGDGLSRLILSTADEHKLLVGWHRKQGVVTVDEIWVRIGLFEEYRFSAIYIISIFPIFYSILLQDDVL